MIRTVLILNVLAAGIAGCADVIVDDPYLVGLNISYSRPNTKPKQADADWAKCQKENMSDVNRGMNAAEKRLAKKCMEAKGYTVTERTVGSSDVKNDQTAF